MEENVNFSICSHRYKTLKNKNILLPDDCKDILFEESKYIDYDIVYNLHNWLTQTLTVVFRRDCINLNSLIKYKYIFDSTIFYNILRNGNGRCFNKYWGVYRIHSNGIFSGRNEIEYTKMYYEAWKSVYEIENEKYSKDIYEYFLLSYVKILIKHQIKGNFRLIKKLIREYFRLINKNKYFSFSLLLLRLMAKSLVKIRKKSQYEYC